MVFKRKSIRYILALVLISPLLNGCIAVALVPTALNLAAEGYSVHTTGQTITENIKDAILDAQKDDSKESVQVASLRHPAIPPRKPTPPQKQVDMFVMTDTVGTIGKF